MRALPCVQQQAPLLCCAPDDRRAASHGAEWENDLDAISSGSMSVEDFSAQQEGYVRELLANAKTSTIAPPKNIVKCPQCGKAMVRRKGTKGFFGACSGYPECKATLPDKNGKPDTAPKRPTMKARKF